MGTGGLATARTFAEAGAALALADVHDDALALAEDELRKAGHQALAVHCDVSDEGRGASGWTYPLRGSPGLAARGPLGSGPNPSAR
ncbi:MAG: SDR family oxidoreductase [Streptosporangiaceae bacterium]